MKKILIYIFGLVFIFSASKILANTCATNLKFCNDTQICIQATRGVGKADLANKVRLEPNRVWSSAPLYKHFVETAKQRGLDCGVKEETDKVTTADRYSCLKDLKKCSDEVLCKVAVKVTDGFAQVKAKKPIWNRSIPHHVAEAKKRGLDCGVESKLKAQSSGNKKYKNTMPNYYDMLDEIKGNWSGVIECDKQDFPFEGTFHKRPYKRMLFQTDNFEYKGDYSVNHHKNTVTIRAFRNDGQKYNETLNYSRATQMLTGKTSEGCFVKAKKSGKLQNTIAINQFTKSDFNKLNFTERKQMQYALQKLGYYTSSVDGLYGPNTERASRAYAKAKDIKKGYPYSILKKLTSEVKVPSSFSVASKRSNSSSAQSNSSKSDAGQALIRGVIAIGLCNLAPNPSACFAQATTGRASAPSGGKQIDGWSSDGTCSRNANCDYNEVCVPQPGLTRGVCMTKPNNVSRNWSPQTCSRDSQCPINGKCDRTYKVCVER